MNSEPKIEERPAQPTVGIRTQVPMHELPQVIPQLTGEVFGWLRQQGIPPSGAPFIRYHVIDMESKLDIELGLPVAQPLPGDGRVAAGALPAGRYATLVYTGPYEGNGLMVANRALLEWGAGQGLEWDRFDDPNGDGFVARYESYLTDPAEVPDPAQYVTEVAIRVADN